MALIFAQSKLLLGVGGSVAAGTVGGGSYLAHQYFIVNKSVDARPQNTQNTLSDETPKQLEPDTLSEVNSAPENTTEVLKDTPEEVGADNSKAAVKPTSTPTITDTNYQYVLATVEASSLSATNKLYGDSDAKNFLCKFTKDEVNTTDTYCKIFKLNSDADKAHLLDLTKIKSDASLIKEDTAIVAGTRVILKISNDVFTAYKADTTTDKKLLVVTKGDTETELLSLKDLVELKKTHTDKQFDISSSNLVLVKLTSEVSSSPAINTTTQFDVELSSQTISNCKLYKLDESFQIANIGKDPFSAITALTSSSDLTNNKFYVLDLGTTSKSSKDLEHKVLSIKTAGTSTQIATASFEHLLFGEVKAALSESIILPVANVQDKAVTSLGQPNTQHRYIVTKSTEVSTRTDLTTAAKNNLLCRLDKADGTRYEDDACEASEWDNTDNAKVDLVTNTPITSTDKFGNDKLQLIKVKASFYDQLSKENPTFDLIQKDKKDQQWHSKYATLSKEFDLTTSNAETKRSAKSKLALVRLTKKSVDTGKFETTVSHGALYCKDETSSQDSDKYCNIYKFDASKISNDLNRSDFKNLTKWDFEASKLTVGELYVISYINTAKGFSDYKENSKIYASSHQTSAAKVLEFDFDQMIYGSINETPGQASTIFPKANKTLDLLVELDATDSSSWANIETSTNYRCKLSAETSSKTQGTNYDNSCKLVEIANLTDSKTVTKREALKDLQPTSTQSALTLKSSTKKFFKLIWDPQKMFNFVSENMATKDYVVELVSNDITNTKTFGKFKVKQKIETNKFFGKVDMFVVNTKTAGSSVSGSGKCKFTDAATDFGCSFHEITTVDEDARLEKITITESAISTSTSIEVSKYYLVKAETPQAHNNWSITTLTFTESDKSIAFDIKKFVSGSIASANKELFYLKTLV